MKISILTSKNQWFEGYALQLSKALNNANIYKNHNDIQENYDIVFILSCHQIIPQKALAKNRHNIVIHASFLPKGKGWAPLFWQILDGKNKIPAAIHQSDQTARAQILRKNQNPELWDLINKFYKKTGVPALVNTSFNLHGKPIVNNLQDALHVFENSGLDVLWLENHIIEKIDRKMK